MQENKLPAMRTIQEAYNHLKKQDENTALTEYALRQAVISGALPSLKCGKKYLINLDTLNSYLLGELKPASIETQANYGQLRKIF